MLLFTVLPVDSNDFFIGGAMTKKEQALEYHKKGYNCCQAVACTFCKDFGVPKEEMFRIAEGFGFGMGTMETCGAVTGMVILIGLENSIGDLENGRPSKTDTYKKVKAYTEKFRQKNKSTICRDLKGVTKKIPICSCDKCIEDAVGLVEEYLLETSD